MMMRPGRRVGRRGLLGTAATTAVVAGTATAVSGSVRRHQEGKAQESADAAAAQQAAPPQAAPAPPPPAAAPAGDDDVVAKLNELAQLKAQGLLSDEEFTAAKAKLLG